MPIFSLFKSIIQCFFIFSFAGNNTLEVLNQARGLMQNQKWESAEKLLQKNIDSHPQKNLELIYFQLATTQLRQEKYDLAQENFQKSFEQAENLKEYSAFFLAQIAEKKQEFALAEKHYREVDQLAPNFSLKLEAQKNLAALLLAKKDFRSVRQLMLPLERRSRGSEIYPELISLLAQAELGLKNKMGACKIFRKLYSRYPTFYKIKDWNQDLAINLFLYQPTQCQQSMNDFKDRVRSLLWLGQDQKAFAEIQNVRTKNKEQEPVVADTILAQYYLQVGEVQKAFETLKPYFKSMKSNFDFLLFYATTAARSGDNTGAVGAYYQAYRLSPRSAPGRKALYQSAFLSYQFLDYDGAYRKFQEFIQKYPRSGLKKDAEWHLAWLKYLKQDYSGAYQSFAKIQKNNHLGRRRLLPGSDRTQYWMAMSLLKQGKRETAKILFEKLSQDKLMGYYSLVAQARLKQILNSPVETKIKLTSRELPHRIDRFNMNEFMMPADDLYSESEGDESEENVQLANINSETATSDSSLGSEPVLENINPNDKTEVTDTTEKPIEKQAIEGAPKVETVANLADEIKVTDFKNPLLAQRFQKARDLQILGFDDWAKWDLYEIEKKTRNKEYLKSLMTEYSNLKNFHRSSYIAQTYFSLARESYGIEGIKFLWQEAFPQAYQDEVFNQSKKFDVPTGLIWGIMRAESHYRQDAISPVGALGLMQIMPSTGHRMAEKIGLKEFLPSQLLNPPVAIQVGTSYLQRLMKKFNRNTALVAAAYNAGPHRVYSWLSSFGQLQMDEFIEHIPFLETRNYVKKVVTNQQTYSQIYGLNQNLVPMLSESIQVTIPDRIPAKESWEDI